MEYTEINLTRFTQILCKEISISQLADLEENQDKYLWIGGLNTGKIQLKTTNNSQFQWHSWQNSSRILGGWGLERGFNKLTSFYVKEQDLPPDIKI